MSIWQIVYWIDKREKSDVEKWLDSLTGIQLKSVAKELEVLRLCGNRLGLPHSRSLGEGLFELRERKFGYRIYYKFLADKKIVLLRAGNKKTQKKDIEVALTRAKK